MSDPLPRCPMCGDRFLHAVDDAVEPGYECDTDGFVPERHISGVGPMRTRPPTGEVVAVPEPQGEPPDERPDEPPHGYDPDPDRPPSRLIG